ncbi:hypothetical protein ACFQI7_11700 [Paenibacillus allorhizosphaerae]|uniref:YtxH domain-containing protein n=1 Tax=Paenibacillus allorhizosphaerae TaxID=2849866 RepID=A0ABN7TJX6_9BACL|nr:hypothetical protein [Paenibacillus allorhizosphaerae]CAG7641482.1 hypothetical protein PAECIP111802_02746 [Paenibacillus allorhizosphaerae]
MRFGSFLFGGIVGAAAVVYLSNRNKSMLWSVLTKNGSLGSMMNQTNSDKSESAKTKLNDTPAFSKSAASSGQASQSSSPAKSAKGSDYEEVFSSGHGNKVSDIVNQDPNLKSQVEEILTSNKQKEQLQVQ